MKPFTIAFNEELAEYQKAEQEGNMIRCEVCRSVAAIYKEENLPVDLCKECYESIKRRMMNGA